MSGLFVFFTARRKDGDLRVNNAVFSDCSPVATLDDIADLQRSLELKYDYEPDTVRIQNWQRMETLKPAEKTGAVLDRESAQPDPMRDMILSIAKGQSERESVELDVKNDRVCIGGKWYVPSGTDKDPVQKWQPIETAPKDGSYFLAYPVLFLTPLVITWDIKHGGWRVPLTQKEPPYKPTHWIPYPDITHIEGEEQNG